MMSSSLSPGRQSYKRRGTRQSKRGMRMDRITIDLNSPAPGADAINVASSSRSMQNTESNPSPIYVEIDADDDVQLLSPSGIMPSQAPQAPQAPIVVLDEEDDLNPGPSGVTREERQSTINLDLTLDLEIDPSLFCQLNKKYLNLEHPSFQFERKEATNRPTHILISLDSPSASSISLEQPQAPPKEPTFSCPVCMSALVEPSSTICGHIFCKECIRASIQAQKKCPTCRRTLNMKNFHRVYLPSAE